jgi:MoxR-like ATPase
MQIDVGYPSLDAERRILFETTGVKEASAKKVLTAKRLQEMQNLVRRIPVGESVVHAILELVRSARPGAVDDVLNGYIEWGPGPRASQALMLATRARAMLQGRLAPSVDDVTALAVPVLQHRMQLSFSARAAEKPISVRDVIAERVSRIG